MWPVLYMFGQRFSSYLVLPIAAAIGTVGYFVEKKFFPKPQAIPYLEKSVQEQREQRLARGETDSYPANILPNTLGVLKPKPHEE